jgi:hypothetical protein
MEQEYMTEPTIQRINGEAVHLRDVDTRALQCELKKRDHCVDCHMPAGVNRVRCKDCHQKQRAEAAS